MRCEVAEKLGRGGLKQMRWMKLCLSTVIPIVLIKCCRIMSNSNGRDFVHGYLFHRCI
jgi:hypothetical protein